MGVCWKEGAGHTLNPTPPPTPNKTDSNRATLGSPRPTPTRPPKPLSLLAEQVRNEERKALLEELS